MPVSGDYVVWRRPADAVRHPSALALPAVTACGGTDQEPLGHHQPAAPVGNGFVVVRLGDINGRIAPGRQLPSARHQNDAAVVILAHGNSQHHPSSTTTCAQEDQHKCHHHRPRCARTGSCSSNYYFFSNFWLFDFLKMSQIKYFCVTIREK